MGRQIAIAQSLEDEMQLINELNKKFDLKCLPKLFKTSEIKPERLGKYKEQTQMIFLAKEEERVVNNIRNITDDPTTFLIYPFRGYCIEWGRTMRQNEKNYPGRFYINLNSTETVVSVKELLKVYTFIVYKIKKTYPGKSAEKYPTYIGPNLFNLVIENGMEINWENGKPKEIIRNDF